MRRSRFFAPALLAAQLNDERVEVWLTNDLREEVRQEAKVTLLDFKGKVLMEETSFRARTRREREAPEELCAVRAGPAPRGGVPLRHAHRETEKQQGTSFSSPSPSGAAWHGR